MLRVCTLTLLLFNFGNAEHMSNKEYSSELEVTTIYNPSNETLTEPKSVLSEPRSTVDINGCKVCSRKYLIGKQKVNFNTAVLLCNQIGMEIASPMSADEENAIKNLSNDDELWIGGKRCSGCLSDFIWIATGKPIVYSDFWPMEPNNAKGNEDCIELLRSGKVYQWNDTICNKTIAFACQSKCCCNNN